MPGTNTNLLARNLRYHVAGRDIDNAIKETIASDPDSFWLKNNGITVICDDFEIDGKDVRLKNFSIVNGGQTTYMLHKSTSINMGNDLYLPCKIIKIAGDAEDDTPGLVGVKAASGLLKSGGDQEHRSELAFRGVKGLIG